MSPCLPTKTPSCVFLHRFCKCASFLLLPFWVIFSSPESPLVFSRLLFEGDRDLPRNPDEGEPEEKDCQSDLSDVHRRDPSSQGKGLNNGRSNPSFRVSCYLSRVVVVYI
jgi:hypothetical protein